MKQSLNRFAAVKSKLGGKILHVQKRPEGCPLWPLANQQYTNSAKIIFSTCALQLFINPTHAIGSRATLKQMQGFWGHEDISITGNVCAHFLGQVLVLPIFYIPLVPSAIPPRLQSILSLHEYIKIFSNLLFTTGKNPAIL